MRRFLRAYAVCAAALLASSGAEAQSFAFKLGSAQSTFNVSDEDSGLTTVRYLTGGAALRFGGRLGFQPELLFVSKGARLEAVEEAPARETRIDYLEIPLLLHIPLTWGAVLAPYLLVGPAVSVDLGCEFITADATIDCDDAGDASFTRRAVDVGISAGGGVAFVLGPGAFLLEARYTWGLLNINENATGDTTEINNRSALFLAGYSIPVGPR